MFIIIMMLIKMMTKKTRTDRAANSSYSRMRLYTYVIVIYTNDRPSLLTQNCVNT